MKRSYLRSAGAVAALCASSVSGALGQEQIELDYWVYSDFAQGEALEIQQSYIDAFEQSHPGVTINISGRGDDALTSGQVAGAMSGTGPDVFMNSTSAGATLVRAGAMKNVYEEWMAMPEEFRAQFNQELIDVCTPEPETMYCLPYTGYGSFLFRNLTVLEEAGIDPDEPIRDWDHWLEQMQQISDAGKYAIPDMTQVWSSFLEVYSGVASSDEWGADFDAATTKLSAEKYEETAQMFLNMAPYSTGTSRNDQATRDLFINDELAFYVNGPWMNPQLEQAAEESGLKYDWVLVPGATEEQKGGIKGHEILAVAPNEHADVAWEFAAFVAEKQQITRWASTLGRYVANDAAMAEPEVAEHPLIEITKRAQEEALFNRPPFFVEPYPNDYWSALTDNASAIVEGDMTPEEGAQALVERLNAILQDG